MVAIGCPTQTRAANCDKSASSATLYDAIYNLFAHTGGRAAGILTRSYELWRASN